MNADFIGDLTTTIRTVMVSRKRVLQVFGGVIAAAVPARLPQSAEAGKHRKPPLVFVSATVTDIAATTSNAFTYSIVASYGYPSYSFDLKGKRIIDPTISSDVAAATLRGFIATEVKANVLSDMQDSYGVTVPLDRIAVTLL
jgi:hypothetical protein